MSTAHLGIDPGLSGAVALISPDGSVRFWDTPTVESKDSKGRLRRLFAAPAMADLLREATVDVRVHGDLSATIEDVHSMPEQGIAGAFSFGRGFGIWIGILATLEIPTNFVSPQRWKKSMLNGSAGKDKSASRLRAMELFPAVSDCLNLKKHDGRAEALLMAEFARRAERCAP